MDFRVLSAVLGFLCLILVYFAFSGGGGLTETVFVNRTVYPEAGLEVFYLFPGRCVDCDLTIPGQCDFCNSYYDDRVMDLLSNELGVPLQFRVSEYINRPGLLVVTSEKMDVGDAGSRHNMAKMLCDFAKVEESCDFHQGFVDDVRSCSEKYGVVDGLIYHTSSIGCSGCLRTDEVVGELVKLYYNDSLMYDAVTFDRQGEGKNYIAECLPVFDNNAFAPQLVCTKTARDLTGIFTLGEATDFADECIEAG
jgi:hypothetical protein